MSESRPDQGSVLVVALWAVSAAALAAAAIIALGRVPQYLARNAELALREELMLQKGAALAIQGLLEQTPDWQADAMWRIIRIDGIPLRIRIQDEAGKIDLNTATDDQLAIGLTVAGVELRQRASILDAIQDWRDIDGERRLNGAEAADYASKGLAYGPRNRPFVNVDEVQRIIGMSPDIYWRLAPLVTVYSQKAAIDKQAAAQDLLRALPGMDEAAANILVRGRAGTGAAASAIGRSVLITVAVTNDSARRWQAVVRFTGARAKPWRVMAWRPEKTG